MNRYLLYISYLGTNFRGLQKVINKVNPQPLDNSTVQSALEFALQRLQPANEIKVVISSRTDSGVHALHSAVHVDLERRSGKPYEEHYITSLLNQSFKRDEIAIRVLNTRRVPDTFHCRYSAQSRSYLYRVAVAKTFQVPDEHQKRSARLNFIPVEELNRCFFVANPLLDIEKAREAAKLIQGYHDFRTFMSVLKDNSRDHAFFAVRRIDELSITPGKALVTQPNISRTQELYNYWDFTFVARSFVYRQVRRIVGTLLAVAEGKLTQKDVYEMLTIPSKHSWPNVATIAPPYALYLTQVTYREEDLCFPQNESPGEDSGASEVSSSQ
ncbi:tRNA pseudouridine synthase-like 1 [Phlebotomus argentipes]|uniref:tRNA pseudouridine synthase-like 1 n=1 Tax=Phlebotomus argentipes TaxID=94469 RepID=UPI0028936379|nr:tRNA pseudouridine synthase-like 1 [Phlebotomus argentipes]